MNTACPPVYIMAKIISRMEFESEQFDIGLCLPKSSWMAVG
jgi:hypothetical protein